MILDGGIIQIVKWLPLCTHVLPSSPLIETLSKRPLETPVREEGQENDVFDGTHREISNVAGERRRWG